VRDLIVPVAFRERRSPLWQPTYCTWLAEAHATCGEISQGLDALKMGRQAAAGGTHWMDAELHRAAGELLQVGGRLIPPVQKRVLLRLSRLPDRNRHERWNCVPQ
jgi:hypothetical protein